AGSMVAKVARAAASTHSLSMKSLCSMFPVSRRTPSENVSSAAENFNGAWVQSVRHGTRWPTRPSANAQRHRADDAEAQPLLERDGRAVRLGDGVETDQASSQTFWRSIWKVW